MPPPPEPPPLGPANRERIGRLLAELGLTFAHPRLAALRAFEEAAELAPARCAATGEERLLSPPAAAAWRSLEDAAAAAGVALELISGFRSYTYQAELIRRAQAGGRALEEILRSIAPPGFSEHHTGEAVDLGGPGAEELTASFGETAAYRWLAAEAGRFGWTMSYPAGNTYGFIPEPWHWRWRPAPFTP